MKNKKEASHVISLSLSSNSGNYSLFLHSISIPNSFFFFFSSSSSSSSSPLLFLLVPPLSQLITNSNNGHKVAGIVSRLFIIRNEMHSYSIEFRIIQSFECNWNSVQGRQSPLDNSSTSSRSWKKFHQDLAAAQRPMQLNLQVTELNWRLKCITWELEGLFERQRQTR